MPVGLQSDALDEPIDLGTLHAFLAEVDVRYGLNIAALVASEYEQDPGRKEFSRLVNPINLTLWAKAMVLWAAQNGRDLTVDEVKWVFRAINALRWYPEDQIQQDPDQTVLSFLVRQAYVLNVLQDPDDDVVARTFTIFHDLPLEVEVPVRDISSEVRRIIGISAEDLWAITFAIYSHYVLLPHHKERWLILLTFFDQSPNRERLRSSLAVVLGRIGRTVDELRTLYNQNQKYRSEPTEGGWISEFNLLRDYPLVRIRDDAYVAPYPKFAMQRGAVGFYYDLLDDFAERERQLHPDRNPYRNRMSQTFQILYQEYVGRQLRSVNTLREHVFGEFKYGPKKAQKDTPDWILSRAGNWPVFFECKARRPALALQSTATSAQIEADLLQTVVYALVQFSKFLAAVDAGVEGLERFEGLGNVFYSVVMYDPVPFHAIPDLRKKIVDLTTVEIEKQSGAVKGAGTSFWAKVTFVPLSIRDLEAAVGLEATRGIKLEEQLRAYSSYRDSAPRVRWTPQGPEFPHHLEEYLQETWNEGRRIKSPLCVQQWDRFTAFVHAYIFGRSLGEEEVELRKKWVQVAAFFLAEKDGHPPAREWHYWFEAEKQAREEEARTGIPPWLHE